jgi:hypothetical protein
MGGQAATTALTATTDRLAADAILDVESSLTQLDIMPAAVAPRPAAEAGFMHRRTALGSLCDKKATGQAGDPDPGDFDPLRSCVVEGATVPKAEVLSTRSIIVTG